MNCVKQEVGIKLYKLSGPLIQRYSNVFLERCGPTSYCHRSVVNGSPYSAFHLFIDEHMLRCIQKHTINHGKKDNDDFDLHVDELESFVGLQIA